MSGIWSTDDKLFVDGKLGILSFDLKFASSPSHSLPVERRLGIKYDGPEKDKFKHFLSTMGYLVNNKGRVVVAVPSVPRDDDEVEAFRYFLLEKVVPLGPFGFSNKPIPKNQQETILRAELEKKNDELNELRGQLLKNKVKLEDVKFDPPRVLVSTDSNFLGFCRRMSRTYVNLEGDYIKFDFTALDAVISYAYPDILYYCDEDCWITSPFTWVQYDESSPKQDIDFRRFYEPSYANTRDHGNPGTWLVNEALSKARNCLSCAFILGKYRFYGQITRTSGTFRNNALVNVFFDQCQNDSKYCYVDALGTTFFVLDTAKMETWDTKPLGKPPRLLD